MGDDAMYTNASFWLTRIHNREQKYIPRYRTRYTGWSVVDTYHQNVFIEIVAEYFNKASSNGHQSATLSGTQTMDVLLAHSHVLLFKVSQHAFFSNLKMTIFGIFLWPESARKFITTLIGGLSND